MAHCGTKGGYTSGQRQSRIYHLAAAQSPAGGASPFHDVTSGNNSVPGVTGFTAATGYDQATGWGSVDADKLVTAWGLASASTPALALTVSSASVVLSKTGATAALSTVVSGGLSSSVSLSVSGLPAGLTAAFKPASIASPGSGSTELTLTPGASRARLLDAYGHRRGRQRHQNGHTHGIAAWPGMTLTPASVVLAKTGATMTLTTAVSGGLSSSVSLSVSGLPAGLTAAFKPALIASPGSGSTETDTHPRGKSRPAPGRLRLPPRPAASPKRPHSRIAAWPGNDADTGFCCAVQDRRHHSSQHRGQRRTEFCRVAVGQRSPGRADGGFQAGIDRVTGWRKDCT